jgi:GNAT superfamily N-acetyltransferase
LTLTFRTATEADIPAMSAIRLAVTENRLSDPSRITTAMYLDYLDHRGRSWVAQADGVIAGFACADKIDGSVWALFVSPEREGLGIGKQLLALLTRYLFAQGHETIVLGTGPDTRADAFYAAQGWERGERIKPTEVQYTLRKLREPSHVHPA